MKSRSGLYGVVRIERRIDDHRPVGDRADGVAVRVRPHHLLRADRRRWRRRCSRHRPAGRAGRRDAWRRAGAIRSVPPPAGNGTITLIGRVRPSLCATASAGSRQSEAEHGCRFRQECVALSSSRCDFFVACRHQIAAAMASPICVRAGLAAEVARQVLALGDHLGRPPSGSGRRRRVAFGSLCLRPSQPSSICPDMIIA